MLYIVRGLPGSGKSTLAATLTGRASGVFAADDYFVDPADTGANCLKCSGLGRIR